MASRSLQEQLVHCGFTPKEARIYLDCFTHGASSVQQIADRLKLNRITVHSAAEQLLERGMLLESREGRRRLLIAEEPAKLSQIAEAKEIQLRNERAEIEQLISALSLVAKQDRSTPHFRVYKGVEGLKGLLDETLEADNMVRVFIDIEQFVSLLSADYLLHYYERRAKRGIRSKLIWPDCEFSHTVRARQERWNMEVRLSPNFKKAKVGFFSWNNKVGIKSLVEDKLTCTIIESKEIARFYQSLLFDQIWASLPAD